MFHVENFAVKDLTVLVEVVGRHPFATVTTVSEGKPFVNHLPVTFSRAGGELTLFGHMSKRNPQWLHMRSGSPVVIAFHGPHCYVNPNWYAGGGVPTWNYVVVHAEGRAEVVEDVVGIARILKQTTEQMNLAYSDPWSFYLPEDLRGDDLAQAIVGFRLRNPTLTGKFKLSQNRTPRDREGVVAGLGTRQDEGSRGVLEWMQRGH